MIACLGWGSLVWDPRALPVNQPWLTDGPSVRADFLRQSADNRITIVLDGSAAPVRSLWASMIAPTLDNAIASLAAREGIPSKNIPRHIGRWSRGGSLPPLVVGLAGWAEAHGIEHVVWTALPPKFNGIERTPSCAEVVAHLSALSGKERENAELYVRRAPAQIETAYRSAISGALGWVAA